MNRFNRLSRTLTGGGGTHPLHLTLCQTYELLSKNPHLKSQPIVIARFCVAKSWSVLRQQLAHTCKSTFHITLKGIKMQT